MSERHDLGDDKFIELLDPDDLTSKQHRQFTAILTSETMTFPLGSRTLAMRDYLLANCLDAWSFGDKPKRNGIENLEVPNRYWKQICVILDRYGANFSLSDIDIADADPQKPSDD